MKPLLIFILCLTYVVSTTLNVETKPLTNVTFYVGSPLEGQVFSGSDTCLNITCPYSSQQLQCWKCNSGTDPYMGLAMEGSYDFYPMTIFVGSDLENPQIEFSISTNTYVGILRMTQYGYNEPIYELNTFITSIIPQNSTVYLNYILLVFDKYIHIDIE